MEVAERDAMSPCHSRAHVEDGLGPEIIVSGVLPSQIDGRTFSGRWLKREEWKRKRKKKGGGGAARPAITEMLCESKKKKKVRQQMGLFFSTVVLSF